MFHFHKGQSITEYTLAAALVAIVSIGALTFFANDFAASLPGLLDAIFGGGGTAGAGGQGGTSWTTAGAGGQSSIPGQRPVNPPAGLTPGGTASGPSWSNTQPVCAGSVCFDIPVVDQTDVETAGGNGELTTAFADVIQQIAEELEKQDPPPDSALLGMIHDLANYGHEIGWEQSDYDREVRNMCNGADYCSLGNTGLYHNPDYSTLVPNRDVDQDGEPDAIVDFVDLRDQISAYLTQNPDALPPAIAHVLDMEAGQIESLAHGTMWLDPAVAGDAHNNYTGTDSSSSGIDVESRNTAQILHQDANVVCGTGNGGSICTVNPANGKPKTGGAASAGAGGQAAASGKPGGTTGNTGSGGGG